MNLHEFSYWGGGYFRKKGVPKGKDAPILHGPELLKAAQDLQNERDFWHDENQAARLQIFKLEEERGELEATLQRTNLPLWKKLTNTFFKKECE